MTKIKLPLTINTNERFIDKNFDYSRINGLTFEAREKLTSIKPETLGQASRIAGISPADISILILNLKRKIKKGV